MSENKTLREAVEQYREAKKAYNDAYDKARGSSIWPTGNEWQSVEPTLRLKVSQGEKAVLEAAVAIVDADTPSVQSAPDTVRRQEAIRELQDALAATASDIHWGISTSTINTALTALSALKDRVLIPYIGEVSG